MAIMVWRDILVCYKQTVIGVAWSLIWPIITMIVFTVVFGYLAKLPSDGVPYLLLVYAAMLPCNFSSNALSESSGSLIGNANLLSTIYLPRINILVSSIFVSLIDIVISPVNINGYIDGRGSEQVLADIHDNSVSVVGELSSVLLPLTNAMVAVVPLCFESGTRFNILEAGACGIPVVSTILRVRGTSDNWWQRYSHS